MLPLVLTDAELPSPLLALIANKCRVELWAGASTPPALLTQAEGLLTYGHPFIGGPQMDLLPRLRIISNFGVGVDHLDVPAAQLRKISVGNTPGFVDNATADMTMALILSIARNIVIGDRYARSPEFTSFNPSILHGQDVTGKTLGIVGMGAIGKKVAKRAAGFDMRILYHNRKPDPSAQALAAAYVSLEVLLAESDFVALNVPLTSETRAMISHEQLRQMKPTACLINVARGAVVDHDALHLALTKTWIAGAALDVTEPEPLPRDHPLLQHQNLIIVPHLGSATREARQGMYQRTAENLLAGLSGESLPSRVA
ncbi:MAG: D-glycerate dehydrogenase [Burkholderiaceae bacterium]